MKRHLKPYAGLTAAWLALAGCQAISPLMQPASDGFTLQGRLQLAEKQRTLQAYVQQHMESSVDHITLALYRSSDGTHYTDTGASRTILRPEGVPEEGETIFNGVPYEFKNLRPATHYMVVPFAYTYDEELINRPQTFDANGVPNVQGEDVLAIPAQPLDQQFVLTAPIAIFLADAVFDGRAKTQTGVVFTPGFTNSGSTHFDPFNRLIVSFLAGERYPDANAVFTPISPTFFDRAPGSLAIDPYSGDLIVADSATHRILRVNRNDGSTSLIAGAGTDGYQNGTGASAHFSSPAGVAVASDSTIYVGDAGNHLVRKITGLLTDGPYVVSDFAGTTDYGAVDGPANTARFTTPSWLALDESHGFKLYVADWDGSTAGTVREVAASGEVETLAGLSGAPAGDFSFPDGQGNTARLAKIGGIAVKPDDEIDDPTVFISESNLAPERGIIRKIDSDGTTTKLFTGPNGFRDGPSPLFNKPGGLAYGTVNGFGSQRFLWVSDADNHRIRAVDVTGENFIGRTAVGNGTPGNRDSYGSRTALLNGPVSICPDPAGNGGFFLEANSRTIRYFGAEQFQPGQTR